MESSNPISNIWFWLFYHAIPFVLKHLIRIVTVCCLKLYEKVPLMNMITPLLEFVMVETQKFFTGGNHTPVE